MKKELKQKIWNYYKMYYKDSLNLPNWSDWIQLRLAEEETEREKIKKLEKLLERFSGKKILDVGCGTGGFLVEAKRKGAIVFGIDPEERAIEICKTKGLKNVRVGTGENLPYPDDFFNIVYCYTVLEHVKDVTKTLKEMVRVTKVGGKIYIQTPNYLACYEGHYKIFWLPLFPKFLAKIYLFLRGRPTRFLDSINYLTPKKIKDYLKGQNVKLEFKNYKLGKASNFLEKFIFLYYKLFNIDPQIELLITKR